MHVCVKEEGGGGRVGRRGGGGVQSARVHSIAYVCIGKPVGCRRLESRDIGKNRY